MTPELVLRHLAVQNTFDAFAHKPFVWGKADCANLVSHCLRGLGHDDPMRKIGRYTTRLGALKQMRRAGIVSFHAWLDAHFDSVAPADTLPGDIVTIRSDDEVMTHALGLRITGLQILAYAPVGDEVLCALGPFDVADKAWRVL